MCGAIYIYNIRTPVELSIFIFISILWLKCVRVCERVFVLMEIHNIINAHIYTQNAYDSW